MEKEPEGRCIEFVPMTFDFMFKAVMKKNQEIFKNFLIDTMDLKIDSDSTSIHFLDSELVSSYRKEKGKRVDLRVRIGDGLVITVEVNRMKYNDVKDRNNLFFEKIDVLQFEIGDEYKNFKYKQLYQLNLNCNEDEDGFAKRKVMDYDVINKIVFDERKVKYVITLAYYYNMYYNDSSNMSLNEIFLAGLMSKNFTEIFTIMSKVLSAKDLDKFMESVVDMCKELENIHEWQREKMNAMVQNNIYESGKEEALTSTIKKLLGKNMSYQDISDVTGKSIKDIKQIEHSISK